VKVANIAEANGFDFDRNCRGMPGVALVRQSDFNHVHAKKLVRQTAATLEPMHSARCAVVFETSSRFRTTRRAIRRPDAGLGL